MWKHAISASRIAVILRCSCQCDVDLLRLHWTCETSSMRVFLRKHHTFRVDWTSMLTGSQRTMSPFSDAIHLHTHMTPPVASIFFTRRFTLKASHLVKFFLPPYKVLVSAPQLSSVMNHTSDGHHQLCLQKTSSLPPVGNIQSACSA